MGEAVGQFNPIAATVGAAREQSKAARAQRRQAAAQMRMSNIEMQRQRIAQVRESRAKRAQILATSEAAGVVGGSGEAGGIGSIQTQLGANLSFLDTASAFRQYDYERGIETSKAMEKAAMWGAIGQLSGSIFSMAGGSPTIFGGNTSAGASNKTTGTA